MIALTEADLSRIAISDVGFAPPLNSQDEFYAIDCGERDIDLKVLVVDARHNAEAVVASLGAFGGVTEHILALLLNRRYCLIETIQDPLTRALLLQKIAVSVSSGAPVHLMLSLFPCKSCHPLKTLGHTGHEVDIGELACLLRLSEIAHAIRLVYKGGVVFTIYSNGRRYIDVFGEKATAADGYRQNIDRLIDYFELTALTLLHEEDILPPEYPALVHEIETELADKEEWRLPLQSAVEKLGRNVFLNIEPPREIDAKAMSRMVQKAQGGDPHLSAEESRIFDEMFTSVGWRVRRYVSINLALAQIRAFERHDPRAIKATVRPKAGQLGFSPLGEGARVFPHNGQGVLVGGPPDMPKLARVRTEYLANIARDRSRHGWFGVVLPTAQYRFSDGKYPFVIARAG
jgi:hypothetical protein